MNLYKVTTSTDYDPNGYFEFEKLDIGGTLPEINTYLKSKLWPIFGYSDMWRLKDTGKSLIFHDFDLGGQKIEFYPKKVQWKGYVRYSHYIWLVDLDSTVQSDIKTTIERDLKLKGLLDGTV